MNDLIDVDEYKPVVEIVKAICRCCLTTERPMRNGVAFAPYFKDLAGINVTDSDGLPQWICIECCMLLQKAVKFRCKVLKAHSILCDYLARCWPFPIDAQDQELKKYSSPPLCVTTTLAFDNGKSKLGFQKVLEHEKQVRTTELDTLDIPPAVSKDEAIDADVKEELNFSDYEDNITLEEYRSNAKLTEAVSKITDDEIAEFFNVNHDEDIVEEGSRRKSKRKGKKHKSSDSEASALDTAERPRPKRVRRSSELSHDGALAPNYLGAPTATGTDVSTALAAAITALAKATSALAAVNPDASTAAATFALAAAAAAFHASVTSTTPAGTNVRPPSKRVSKKNRKTDFVYPSVTIRLQIEVPDYTCNATEPPQINQEPKSSIRKAVELDPTKIRLVTLNPEEQIRQREEESKLNLKFPFQCNLCFKGFNFEAKLQNHMTKHSPSRGDFECKLCSMYLPTSYSFNVHSLIHTTRYECMKCGRRMIDRSSILDHYRSQHEGVLTLFTCHLCGKVSSNSKTHRGHMRNHHSGDRAKCEQCGKTFVNKDSLAEHLQIHQGIKNYECSQCGMRFRTRTQIKHHQLKHSTLKEYYCVECDVRFKSSHGLRQHLQKSLRHKDRQSLKYGCEVCDKRFDSARAHAHHVSVQHEGARPHRCAHCPAALATGASLKKHIASVHRGHRPAARHVCDTCGKAFRGKSVLINHVRTHTGEKPFECSACGRKFTQRTAMRTHVKLVHLKIRRSAKLKPELSTTVPGKQVQMSKVEQNAKDNIFPKEESLVFDAWSRQDTPGCEGYFHVAAGT